MPLFPPGFQFAKLLLESEKMTFFYFQYRIFDSKNDFMTLTVNLIAFGIRFEIMVNENN